MELLECANEYLVVDGEHCLRCSRITGQLEPAGAVALAEQANPVCLGIVYGVVGRVEFTKNGPSYLVLVKDRKQVASHPLTGFPIYKIERVVAIPLTAPGAIAFPNGSGNNQLDLQLATCPKHHHDSRNNSDALDSTKPVPTAEFSLLQKGQKMMTKATVDSLKFVTNKMNIRSIGGNKLGPVAMEEKERIRTERRLVLEFLRMFNESGSFYYCPGADLTNCVQRLFNREGTSDPPCRFEDLDSRFVWNSYMLRDLIEPLAESRQKPSWTNHWITPIIQGFVGVENCSVTFGADLSPSPRSRSPLPEQFQFQLVLISRRSIHRAGTRYIKRGIDADGHCANYVATEQILVVGDYGNHVTGFVQNRGSIPVYWSQPGYKYKPSPKLDKSKTENILAFRKHFDEELRLYSNIAIINLVEQSGKEKVLSDTYIDHVLDLDLENVAYVGFDFHEHCRGLKFENVAVLTSAVEEQLIQNGFCWLDKDQSNCLQNGVFRVNCVDCLDRTNVVQAALGRTMLELQLRKFGVLPPEECLPLACLRSFQLLWASNGDAISRQYAGTVALKGDFTRTGQRNLAGMMKDGYNSANRYYLCHMKDARRQAAIDALLGRTILESDQELENLLKSQLESGGAEDEAAWLKEKDEQLRLFVRDCERLVVPDGEVILGGWAFINADPATGEETEEDMDTCVVLTRQAYYVADYDEDLDKFVDFQRVPLEDVQKMEAGPMTVASVLGVPKAKATCLRIYYKVEDSKEEYFHIWRSGSTRLFNNLAIAIKNPDEADEYVKAIAEQFRVALELTGRRVSVSHPPKLERKRTKLPPFKLGYRRQNNSFGTPPVFFATLTSSLGGGMKSFGSRFSAAFGHQSGQAAKRSPVVNSGLNNLHSKDVADGEIVKEHSVIVPPLILHDPTPASSRCTKDAVMNGKAGLLFGPTTPPDEHSESSKALRANRSEEELRHPIANDEKNASSGVATCEAEKDLLIDFHSQSGESAENVSTSVKSPEYVPPFTSASLVIPAADHSLMKTSHSEASFKPLQTEASETGSVQRVLAVSQTALDKTDKGTARLTTLKFPLLFKKKADELADVSAGERTFFQFEERIQKSRTKFILL